MKDDNAMALIDFAESVESMREAQKAYFKTRSKEDLVKSKEREKRVDDLVKRYLSGRQGGLYEEYNIYDV